MRETMQAVMRPDCHSGETCDQLRPRWFGSADGDKDGDGEIGETVNLSAATFPPGTVLKILVPECPACGDLPCAGPDLGSGAGYRVPDCECGFSWDSWARDRDA